MCILLRLRTIKYLIKEGLANTFKNKLMFFASVVTVTATLFILGIFILISENINYLGKDIEKNLKIQIFLDIDIKEDKIKEIGDKIEKFQLGKTELVSKEQAIERLKNMDMFKEHEDVLKGYVLPASFILHIDKAEDAEKAVELLKGIKEINPKDIKYNKEVVDKVVSFMRAVRVTSLVVMVLLAGIAVLIVTNTIKLTVFARRKEIAIMKYIGATDWFIRGPFIVESLTIGAGACAMALLAISMGYDSLIGYLSGTSAGAEIGITNFIPFNAISADLLLMYLIIGIGMSCIGSIISIKKYLKV